MDKRAIAINNKKRGKKLESDVVKLAQSLGLEAKRAWGSNGKALGEHEEVDVMIGDLKFQCKRKKKFPKWMKRSEFVNGHIIREDDENALVVIPLKIFLIMLAQQTVEPASPQPLDVA
jgi:hypothetical protein